MTTPFTAYDSATGQVLFGGFADNPSVLASEGASIRIGEVRTTGYFEGFDHHEVPPAPSPHHTWDWHSHTWIGSLDSARSARRSAVDAERDRRLNFSINYDGKHLDADARARENLKSKLEELKSRDALGLPMSPALMVWRDADNTTHQWETQAAYRAWLEGFAIAMSERGTMIYGAAWVHKSNIDALESIDAIIAYDITSGWPS